MYANDERSSWEEVPVAGDPAAGSFASQEQPVSQTDAEPLALDPEVGEQLEPGLLMSFLTDFRTAGYEQLRKQREEELAKTRKRVPRRAPLPEPEPDESAAGFEGYQGYEGAEKYEAAPTGEPELWEPSPAPEPQGQWTAPAPGADQVNEADFLTAASQAEQPGRRLRLPFGIAGSKNVRQSPATT